MKLAWAGLLLMGWTMAARSAAQVTERALASPAGYCSQAEAYARQHRNIALLFSAVPQNTDPARDRWHRLASHGELQTAEKNANSTAVVTRRDDHVILVDATFQNQFGDSVEAVQYCFRTDGTLAHLHSELTSFHGGMKVIRDVAFDEAGKQTSNRLQSFDLETGKPRQLESDFWDFPPPVFLHVSELPFAKELR